MKRETLVVLLCYALVYVVWGTTYYFIRAAVHTIPASLVVALRFLAGSALLAGLALAKGDFRKGLSWKQAGGSALLGVLLLLLGNGLLTIAEKTIPSYIASLIVVGGPFYIAAFNYLLFRTRISAIRIGGVLVGVAGIAVLLYDGTSLAGTFHPAVLIAVSGSLCWAFGTSVSRALPKAESVFVSTAIQMAVAGGVSLVSAFASVSDLGAAFRGVSPWSWFSVGYLAFMGTVTLVAYNHLLVKEPSFRISSYALVNPLIAVALGLAVGEKATPYLAFGVPLILGGLTLMLYGDPLRERLSARKKAAPDASG